VTHHGALVGLVLLALDEDLADGDAGGRLAQALEQNVAWKTAKGDQ
jgi:hypothetical protein